MDQMERELQGIRNRNCCIRRNWIDHELGTWARRMAKLEERTVEARWVANRMALHKTEAMESDKMARKMASKLAAMGTTVRTEENMMEDRMKVNRRKVNRNWVARMKVVRTREARMMVKMELGTMARKVANKPVVMEENKTAGKAASKREEKVANMVAAMEDYTMAGPEANKREVMEENTTAGMVVNKPG